MLTAVLSGFVLAAAAPWLHARFRDRTSWIVAVLPCALGLYFATSPSPLVESYNWAPALGVNLSFALDGLARLFALLITWIGAIVVVYSGAYLRGHPRLGRFYAYLLVFMASMLGIVLAENVLLLFVFWEITSLSSYFLIGFDHQRPEARAAALQSLLVTGAGGLALLAGLLMLGRMAGTLDLGALAESGDAVRQHALYTPALVLILIGAFTKSAQVPFHFWLPAAMEAPTPVSAYLHSSTMVKAGVYLLARLSPVLGGTMIWHAALGGVGAVTMVLGAMLAGAQTDLKRLLAYATASALGVMTLLLGIGGASAITAMVVFLVAHALYKATLFLAAGNLVHATGERDVTKLGGLRRSVPVTAVAALLAAMSMAGAPPVAGFLGKELVLEAVWQASLFGKVLAAATAAASVLLVAVALSAGLRPFVGATRPAPDAHEGPPALWIGALLLAALGVVFGLAPGLTLAPLVASAALPIAGEPVGAKLALWHGFNPVLALGVLSLAAGFTVYLHMAAVRARLARVTGLVTGPTAWYAAGLSGLNALARTQTRLLQSGYLRRYILYTLTAVVVLVGTSLAGAVAPIAGPWSDVRVHEAAIAVLVLAAAAGTVRSRSRLGAVAALGAVGSGVALLFAMFGAPDLAMTQFAIEALLVLLFVLVLYDVPSSGQHSTRAARTRDLTLAAATGVLMTVLVLIAVTVQIRPPVSGYFVERSVPDAHGHNVVNVILVDFRAIDTLGEITVLASGGIGVYALLRLRSREVRS